MHGPGGAEILLLAGLFIIMPVVLLIPMIIVLFSNKTEGKHKIGWAAITFLSGAAPYGAMWVFIILLHTTPRSFWLIILLLCSPPYLVLMSYFSTNKKNMNSTD